MFRYARSMDDAATTTEAVAPTEVTTETPAPAVTTATLATQAAEQATLARTAADTAAQARDVGMSVVETLSAQAREMAAEVAAMRTLRETMEAERQAAAAEAARQSRVAYLRQAGLRPDVPEADIKALTEGLDEAGLAKWRAERPAYFVEVESPAQRAARADETAKRAAALAARNPLLGTLLGRAMARRGDA